MGWSELRCAKRRPTSWPRRKLLRPRPNPTYRRPKSLAAPPAVGFLSHGLGSAEAPGVGATVATVIQKLLPASSTAATAADGVRSALDRLAAADQQFAVSLSLWAVVTVAAIGAWVFDREHD